MVSRGYEVDLLSQKGLQVGSTVVALGVGFRASRVGGASRVWGL